MRAVVAAVAGLLLVPGAAGAGTSGQRESVDPPPADLPEHAPPAARWTEPELPAPASWPFPERFPRTSGTGRHADGALYWADYLYDDTGDGEYDYPDGDARGNGADIFRVAVGSDSSHSYWRVDWNTLADPAIPAAMFALDTDGDAGTGASQWPAEAGVRSPGIEQALLITATGAWLIDAQDPETRIDVLADGGALEIDLDARSFVLAVPRDVLAADGRWTVRVGGGLATMDGTGFADVEGDDDANLYNVAFRTHEQESVLGGSASNTGAQQAAIGDGDVSPFSVPVDWSVLDARVSEPEPMPTGYTSRWFVSAIELGQGVASRDPVYLGRVQQYVVYVPTTYDPATPTPLTWLLKPASTRYTFFYVSQPSFVEWVCEARGSICASIEQRGPSGGYVDEAELDFWEVWNRLASSYQLDPDRTSIGGVSQGGMGTGRFTRMHPDLFARAFYLTGGNGGDVFTGPYNDETTGVRIPIGVGGGHPTWENVREVPHFIANGGPADLAFGQSLDQAQTLDRLGFRYRHETYPAYEHLTFAGQSIPSAARFLEDTPPRRTSDPGRITYRWHPDDVRPDLGLVHTGAYWAHELAAGDVERDARIDIVSAARPDRPVVEERRDQGVTTGQPTPAAYRELTWLLGTAPDPRPHLDAELENVASMALDLARAGFIPGRAGTIEVRTDRESVLTLRGLAPGVQVAGGGQQVRVTGDGAATLTLPAGTHRIDIAARAPGRGR